MESAASVQCLPSLRPPPGFLHLNLKLRCGIGCSNVKVDMMSLQKMAKVGIFLDIFKANLISVRPPPGWDKLLPFLLAP